ncbi:MAG: aromatic ring-hydroxylating dioxygenase subunit alpha [Planctomycetota bacterium]|nr:MAG: aromatic ring-hydroxylating dioxygenase subunit alpha [Planctomycetota bacterium]
MDPELLRIDPDIRRAHTLPAELYLSPRAYEEVRERVFARSWQFLGDVDRLAAPRQCVPFTLLPGCLDQPLLFTRDERGDLHGLSNVCTHRGTVLCEEEKNTQGLRCRYHGRRFALDGKFVSMPEFEGVEHFPAPEDDLARVPFALWRRFLFAGVAPAFPFDQLVAELEQRVGWLPIERAAHDPARDRDYTVQANWALYCDNYLEGFHIPFVHPALNTALDFTSYRTELFRYSSLQVGTASGGEHVFELPRSSPDHGQQVAGYYFWLFPNLMLNVYPWGISVNIVLPQAPDRTIVRFRSYVWDAARLDLGAGSGLHQVEMEDEGVVEAVQRGVRSRFYQHGRYSPTREQGVHHFHRLLAEFVLGNRGTLDA